jgi:hypothetical protein
MRAESAANLDMYQRLADSFELYEQIDESFRPPNGTYFRLT